MSKSKLSNKKFLISQLTLLVLAIAVILAITARTTSATEISVADNPTFLTLIGDNQWTHISDFSDLEGATTGSGTTDLQVRILNLGSNSTASSTAEANTVGNIGWSTGKDHRVLNWSKRIVIRFPFSMNAGTTNGVTRFTFGKTPTDGVQALNDKGIGIQVDNFAIKGITHNGTSGTTTDLSTTLTQNQVYDIQIASDGAGNIEYFIDGISKGTTSAGPTGDSTNSHHVLQLEVDNGGDSASQGGRLYILDIWIQQ